MKSYLNRGRFDPPKWFKPHHGRVRLKRIPGECQRIEQDLAADRRTLYKSDEAYQDWRGAASRALDNFRREIPLLELWLAEQRDREAETLLREARELLRTFDGDEFDPEETALMSRIDAFFREDDAKQAERSAQ